MLPDHIRISSQPGQDLSEFLSKKNYSKIALLVDENTQKFCSPGIQEAIPSASLIPTKSGEAHKNVGTCKIIWKKMTELNLDRHSVLVVLGGGVLGDMGGFCAATFKRGIDFILIPTTLLAQADASLGGKLGVDFDHFKNQIGVFKEPALNILYSGFLKTLPEHELRSGFAEVIKHALISDEELWNEIRQNDLKNQDWDKLIRHSAEFKSKIVGEDPHEKGLRKILNAGHTVGHAIESHFLAGEKSIMHGEAVAAGLIAESFIGWKRGSLQEESLKSISDYILKIFGKLEISQEELHEIAALSLQDKKNQGNKILCVLPNGIGKAVWNCEISVDEIAESLTYYRSLQM